MHDKNKEIPMPTEQPATQVKGPSPVISKDIAPHMNNKQRRAAAAKLRKQAKHAGKLAGLKEMRKQAKEAAS